MIHPLKLQWIYLIFLYNSLIILMEPFRQLLRSNSATTCQLAVMRVLVVCLLNILYSTMAIAIGFDV